MVNLSLVLAVARNGVIGNGGALPWKFPEDMRHFRQLTLGHAIIMGRRTFESIGRPLPERRNIVVSRTLPRGTTCDLRNNWIWDVARSLSDALAIAADPYATTDAPPPNPVETLRGDPAPIVIGGASLYAEALPLAQRIYLTEVDLEPEGDVRVDLDRSDFVETDRRAGETSELTFVTLERRN